MLYFLLIFVSIVVSTGADIQKSVMSIADHVNLGLIDKFKVITIYGNNDHDCFNDLINKASCQKDGKLIGIYDFTFNLVANVISH